MFSPHAILTFHVIVLPIHQWMENIFVLLRLTCKQLIENWPVKVLIRFMQNDFDELTTIYRLYVGNNLKRIRSEIDRQSSFAWFIER